MVESRIVDQENGQRWEIIFEAEPQGDKLPNGRVRDSGYLTYTGDSEHNLVAMGRGQLKRVVFALTGQYKASMPSLEGKRVQGYVSESKTGFPQVGRYKAVSAASAGSFRISGGRSTAT